MKVCRWAVCLSFVFTFIPISSPNIHRASSSAASRSSLRQSKRTLSSTDRKKSLSDDITKPKNMKDSQNVSDSSPNLWSSAGDIYTVLTDSSYSTEKRLLVAWTYSILSALVVGLSGILPLLIVPLDVGPKLKNGDGAKKLRYLLSFAVGGLLGDVFLHLLPESWKYIASDDEHGHRKMGMLVLFGILLFNVIEMVFAHTESDEDEDDKTQTCIQENGGSSHHHHTNGDIRKRKSSKNGVHTNGSLSNGASNGHLSSAKHSKNKVPTIQISGYLNLLANIMDNFTHGLAISASFLNSTRVGLLTTFAILIHEIPHEVGDFAILLKSGFDRWGAAKAQIITASFGLCGALTALICESAEAVGTKTAFLLPITAGGFIQIALVNVLPDLMKKTTLRESLLQVVCIFMGVLSMAGVTLLTE